MVIKNQTTSSPSFAQSDVSDEKENGEKELPR